MNFRHYDESSMNAAWEAVEVELKQAEMVEPASGFRNRWKAKLIARRAEDQRRQAQIVLIINGSLMALILMLIGVQTLPAFDSFTELMISWFDSLREFLLFFQMVGGIWSSLAKTLPNIVPDMWWVSLAASLGVLVMWWFTSVRRTIAGEGQFS